MRGLIWYSVRCCVDQSIIVAMVIDDDVEEEFGRTAGAGV
jgi:hypothetical protein